MSRWADVDRLLLELSDLIDEFSELDERGLHNERWCGIMDSKGVIVNAPSIDFVRCGECKHWQDNNGGYPTTECRWGHDETPDADDFCSYGCRKGDNDE